MTKEIKQRIIASTKAIFLYIAMALLYFILKIYFSIENFELAHIFSAIIVLFTIMLAAAAVYWQNRQSFGIKRAAMKIFPMMSSIITPVLVLDMIVGVIMLDLTNLYIGSIILTTSDLYFCIVLAIATIIVICFSAQHKFTEQ